MRDTVFYLTGDVNEDAVRTSVKEMAERVAQYVPGYRLKQEVQFTPVDASEPVHTLLPEGAGSVTTKVSVFLEVEGAAHYLPACCPASAPSPNSIAPTPSVCARSASPRTAPRPTSPPSTSRGLASWTWASRAS
jgi:acetaldehyde dehydrogenase